MSRFVITKSQRHRIVGVATVVLIGAIAAVGVTDTGGSGEPEAALPSATFELFSGGDATFAEFEGRPLVVNFWASWCPACIAELPEFESAHQKYDDEVTFVGMANADDRQSALRLADDVGLTYALADDPRGDLFRSFGLIAMPSTVFITADGEIHETFGGQLDGDALGERIDALIGAS